MPSLAACDVSAPSAVSNNHTCHFAPDVPLDCQEPPTKPLAMQSQLDPRVWHKTGALFKPWGSTQNPHRRTACQRPSGENQHTLSCCGRCPAAKVARAAGNQPCQHSDTCWQLDTDCTCCSHCTAHIQHDCAETGAETVAPTKDTQSLPAALQLIMSNSLAPAQPSGNRSRVLHFLHTMQGHSYSTLNGECSTHQTHHAMRVQIVAA